MNFDFEVIFIFTHIISTIIVSTMSGERKAVIKNADMAEDMQQDAVECATQVNYCTIVGGGVLSSLDVPHFTSPLLVERETPNC